MATTHEWTIRTDAGMSTVQAPDIDAAARAWAADEGNDCSAHEHVTDLATLLDYIEGIDGAWLWIESESAPDGARVYAGKSRMA